jgi:hypothetical protein
MDTSTALHVYVDADILFNSLIHDSGYYFDAARWVIAAEARGIPHENIHVYSKVCEKGGRSREGGKQL